MGGEGSMQLSIYTLKSNRALRRSKQRRFLNGGVEKPTRYIHKRLYPQLSDKELEAVKKSIRAKIRRRNLIVNSIGSILFIISALVVLLFWNHIF